MRISEVVRGKGSQVITVSPEQSVNDLLRVLDEQSIGAAVVCDAQGVVGIVSERDVVRHLARSGREILDGPVSSIMTKMVSTCSPQTPIEELESTMTEKRVRHVPVLVDGELAGIVSIGDVVKHRIAGLRDENEQLTAYIQQ